MSPIKNAREIQMKHVPVVTRKKAYAFVEYLGNVLKPYPDE